LQAAVQESALVVLEVTLRAEAERAAASEAEDRRQQEEAVMRRSSSGNGEGPLSLIPARNMAPVTAAA
jgi:hypothetical protein